MRRNDPPFPLHIQSLQDLELSSKACLYNNSCEFRQVGWASMRILDFEAIGKTPTEEITHRSTEGTIPGKLGREFVAFIIQSCDLQACDALTKSVIRVANTIHRMSHFS